MSVTTATQHVATPTAAPPPSPQTPAPQPPADRGSNRDRDGNATEKHSHLHRRTATPGPHRPHHPQRLSPEPAKSTCHCPRRDGLGVTAYRRGGAAGAPSPSPSTPLSTPNRYPSAHTPGNTRARDSVGSTETPAAAAASGGLHAPPTQPPRPRHGSSTTTAGTRARPVKVAAREGGASIEKKKKQTRHLANSSRPEADDIHRRTAPTMAKATPPAATTCRPANARTSPKPRSPLLLTAETSRTDHRQTQLPHSPHRTSQSNGAGVWRTLLPRYPPAAPQPRTCRCSPRQAQCYPGRPSQAERRGCAGRARSPHP